MPGLNPAQRDKKTNFFLVFYFVGVCLLPYIVEMSSFNDKHLWFHISRQFSHAIQRQGVVTELLLDIDAHMISCCKQPSIEVLLGNIDRLCRCCDSETSFWTRYVLAVCCSVLQCVAVCCSVLQCDSETSFWTRYVLL